MPRIVRPDSKLVNLAIEYFRNPFSPQGVSLFSRIIAGQSINNAFMIFNEAARVDKDALGAYYGCVRGYMHDNFGSLFVRNSDNEVYIRGDTRFPREVFAEGFIPKTAVPKEDGVIQRQPMIIRSEVVHSEGACKVSARHFNTKLTPNHAGVTSGVVSVSKDASGIGYYCKEGSHIYLVLPECISSVAHAIHKQHVGWGMDEKEEFAVHIPPERVLMARRIGTSGELDAVQENAQSELHKIPSINDVPLVYAFATSRSLSEIQRIKSVRDIEKGRLPGLRTFDDMLPENELDSMVKAINQSENVFLYLPKDLQDIIAAKYGVATNSSPQEKAEAFRTIHSGQAQSRLVEQPSSTKLVTRNNSKESGKSNE